MKTKRKQRNAKSRKLTNQTTDSISRKQGRQVLKTVAGAVIGGVIAGPVGVAAGAIAGASVRRGPKRRNVKSTTKKAPPVKRKAAKTKRPQKQRFVNIYPNIP
jgi:hypothetical protein